MADVIRMKVGDVKLNENNPRIIKDDKFKKLVESIKNFPEMMDIRPIVVNSQMVILGGNMRFKACKEAGWKTVPVIVADNLSEEQEREFLIKDNVSGGEWDFEMLRNEWDDEKLDLWGLDMPKESQLNEEDLFDIEIPFYTPSEIKPEIKEIANTEKTKELIKKIETLEIDENLKDILKIRASFFTDFNFQKIADFYYKETQDVKEIFKDLGLVILAPKEAVEKGFINLQKDFFDL